MKNKLRALKNHVYRRRGTYGILVGVVVMSYLYHQFAMARASEWYEFVDEHDLLTEWVNHLEDAVQ